jgi:hypothetical protein
MSLHNEKEHLAVKRLRAEASASSSTASRGARAAQRNVATVVDISQGFSSQVGLVLTAHLCLIYSFCVSIEKLFSTWISIQIQWMGTHRGYLGTGIIATKMDSKGEG